MDPFTRLRDGKEDDNGSTNKVKHLITPPEGLRAMRKLLAFTRDLETSLNYDNNYSLGRYLIHQTTDEEEAAAARRHSEGETEFPSNTPTNLL